MKTGDFATRSLPPLLVASLLFDAACHVDPPPPPIEYETALIDAAGGCIEDTRDMPSCGICFPPGAIDVPTEVELNCVSETLDVRPASLTLQHRAYLWSTCYSRMCVMEGSRGSFLPDSAKASDGNVYATSYSLGYFRVFSEPVNAGFCGSARERNDSGYCRDLCSDRSVACLYPNISCQLDSDCPIDQRCIDVGSQLFECRVECASGRDCGGRQSCVDGSCTIADTARNSCDYAYQCPDGYVCNLETCQRLCSGVEECGPGENCRAGICLRELASCQSDAECAAGELCGAGFCRVPECYVNSDCVGSVSCSGYRCNRY